MNQPRPEFVLDANVLYGGLVLPRHRHSPQPDDLRKHAAAQPIIRSISDSEIIAHIPGMIVLEAFAAVRRTTRTWQARFDAVKRWVEIVSHSGGLRLHSMTDADPEPVVDAIRSYGFKAADAHLAALADRLGLPLVTFDAELLARHPAAIEPRP